mmetsp:Transcript_38719/g.44224  ORF Transcript_38719/g.44224 Transcript_38719/m.44224 type:complete len:415 (+) Transcript_38719:189-1433(+)|eukprot:CAMPEP_0194129720 /NCGR_PEP_ID=MMETSP0152-20130528/930_1 /TAXON_ID=1049557 /ORGANISM="Thalassiothrix antarctica, Strain L6-D1" /LENGTH=414 /DNA_ID=CAMNT_0038824043 /DNA_START=90 /DNA_END=1334 /DNA_ORIENTATION=+
MSSFLLDTSKSLFGAGMPRDYRSIRPHHVVLLYSATRLLSSTKLYKKLTDLLLSALSRTTEILIPAVYIGLVPDFLIRLGIRIQCRNHLAVLNDEEVELEQKQKMEIVEELHNMPIAIKTDEANDQHYEVPAKFYDLCLGPCKKYSSGLWPNSKTTFDESEVIMLDLYCERAGVKDGMHIVDLGCGWGSLTLHLIAKYPNCKITSISNSNSQREFILSTAEKRGNNVENITVITCNVANDTEHKLDVVKDNDLVMTVEMFEHMKNYQQLLEKVVQFLKPDSGKLFVHIFSHKDYCYHFDKGWMSDNFFTGGTMPSDDLLLYFSKDFAVKNHWRVNGTNYEKTSNGWLTKLDQAWRAGTLKPVLKEAYGEGSERKWYINWRLFFLACAELFGLDNGNEWIVSLYLFEKRSITAKK